MASITLIDDVSSLNLENNGSVGGTRILPTAFPSNIEYFSFDFYNVYNDTYRSSPWPPNLSITGYMLIKNSSNNTVLYQVDIMTGILKNGGDVLDKKLTYFKINNINSDQLTIEWNPSIPTASTYFSEYVKAYFYVIPPRINVYNNNTDAEITTTSDLYTFTIVDTKYLTFETIGISSITEIKLHLESSSIIKILPIPSNSNNIYKLTIDTTGMTAGMYELIIDVNSRELSFTEFENDSNTYNVKILIPYVFNSYSSVIPITTYDDKNLINTIDLTEFVNSSSVQPGDYLTNYKIKFTYTDENEIMTDNKEFNDINAKIFKINMLLTQLKYNVICKFEILKNSGEIVHTSDNFTLVNQHVTFSKFNLTLYSLENNTILFENDSQWIYMHESDSLNDTNIYYNQHVDVEHVEYVVYFIHGSSELQSLFNDNTKKIQLKVILTNKTNASDTISFTDSTEFIIHKVNNFSAFHTPTITPISNIHYFKEKKFRFNVINNKYSFSFDRTYDIIFKSRTVKPFFDINDKYQNNITITDLKTEQNDVEIDIPYLFTHGKHTLRFYMKNKLEGVNKKSIYDTSSVTQNITSKPIDIGLNVESDALVSCKVQ
tara:strand:+ start:128 stop:1936 length:1809 start_codon:yes stop_codon:yes gene_type:complete